MEIKCTRCGSTWRVSEEKAGKRGRCPQCWGVIKVPDKKVEPAADAHHPGGAPAHHARTAFLVGAVVVLLAGIILTLVLRSGEEVTAVGPDQELAPEVASRIRQRNIEINNLEQIESDCDSLDDLVRAERCLQAREVLRKDKAYEPVPPAEYALRAAVKEEEVAYRAALEAAKQPPPPEWRLDTPLLEEERAVLTQKSAELQRQAKQMKDDMAQLGLNAPERTDSLGRALVDTAEARKLLVARKVELRASIVEIRKGVTPTP